MPAASVLLDRLRACRAAGDSRLPVTLLSGFLGAGKTVLLRRILENRAGLKAAVIVNDMAELNIDAALISRGSGAALVQCEEKLVSLQNGCICCTLREDLLLQVTELAAEAKYDLLVIESTGISEPMQVAETFAFPIPADDLPAATKARLMELLHRPGGPAGSAGACAKHASQAAAPAPDAGHPPRDQDPPRMQELRGDGDSGGDAGSADAPGAACGLAELRLSDWVRLDTCVTVVDASMFLDNLHSVQELRDRYGGAQVPEDDQRTISNLLLDQIEFSDVILLNKMDLLPHATGSSTTGKGGVAARLIAMLQALNPRATIIPTTRCRVDLGAVLFTGRFDMQQASEAPGWLAMLKKLPPADLPGAGSSLSSQLSTLLKSVKPETEEYGISSCVYRARHPFHPLRLYLNFIKPCFLTRVTQAAPPSEAGSDEAEDDSSEEGSGNDESGSGDPEEPGSECEVAATADAAGSQWQQQQQQQQPGAGQNASAGFGAVSAAERQQLLAAQRALLTTSGGPQGAPGCLLRAKGFMWLPSSPDRVVEVSSSGLLLDLVQSHPFFCTLPEDEWPDDPEARAQIRADFSADPSVGDRRQELVLIGQGLDGDAITRLLDGCLLTDAELAEGRSQLEWLLDDPLLGPDSDECSD